MDSIITLTDLVSRVSLLCFLGTRLHSHKIFYSVTLKFAFLVSNVLIQDLESIVKIEKGKAAYAKSLIFRLLAFFTLEDEQIVL